MPTTIRYSISDLATYFESTTYDRIMVLCDENTRKHCVPLLTNLIPHFQIIEIASGETHKNWETCMQIWEALVANHFTRNSLLINVGGGVITDMGGFAASVYKRGIKCIQIPTSLLAMVDASIGAKTGIDFQDIKNTLGTFYEAELTIIDPIFLQTLDQRHLISGYAEMLKHGLIADKNYFHQLLEYSFENTMDWPSLIQQSLHIKSTIVAQDPTEKGLRKTLNFGHTIGHAIESYYLQKDYALLHGEAILYGMIAALFLGAKKFNYTSTYISALENITKKHLGTAKIKIDITQVMKYIQQDKKNKGDQFLLVLLDAENQILYDIPCSQNEIIEALNYLHD